MKRPKWPIATPFVIGLLVVSLAVPCAADGIDASSIRGLLAKSGDIKAFEAGTPQVFRTVDDVRGVSGARPSASEVRRYTAEGFVEGAIVRLHDHAEPAALGLSSVVQFETAGAAREEMKVESREEIQNLKELASEESAPFRFRRVVVPRVLGAVAFAFSTRRSVVKKGVGAGIAKGFLVTERCLATVGVYRSHSSNVSGQIVRAVQRIAARSTGLCP